MKKTVLIADDDHLTREILEFVISTEGHRVVLCEDGRQVLSHLNTVEINLILMDILMPRLNGFETLQKMRIGEKKTDVPVVLMTGVYNQDELQKQMKSRGLKETIIFKPLSLDVIQSIVHRFLGTGQQFHYVFPKNMKNKPGFERRVNLAKLKLDQLQQDSEIRWFMPRTGDLSKTSIIQIFHYLFNSCEDRLLVIEHGEFNCLFRFEGGQLTGYYSNRPEDLMDIKIATRIFQFGKQLLRSDNEMNFWNTGSSMLSLRKMLYRLIHSKQGSFEMKELSEIPENLGIKPVEGLDIKQIIEESMNGPFVIEDIRSRFPYTTSFFRTAEHCMNGLAKLNTDALDLRILKFLSEERSLGEVLSSVHKDSSQGLLRVYALWQLGAIEYRHKFIKSSEMMMERAAESADHEKTQQAGSGQETDAAESINEESLDQMLEHAVGAQYFHFLGLDPSATDHEISEAIKKMKRYLIKIRTSKDISDSLKDKTLTLEFCLHEAVFALQKPKIKQRYIEILQEKDQTKRKKMSDVQFDRGGMCIGEQINYRAIMEFKLAILLHPRNRDAFVQLLQTMSPYPEYRAALFKITQKAIKLFKDNLEFRLILGRYYMEIGEIGKGLDEFRQIIAEDPENIEALQYLIQYPGENKNMGFNIE